MELLAKTQVLYILLANLNLSEARALIRNPEPPQARGTLSMSGPGTDPMLILGAARVDSFHSAAFYARPDVI